MGVGDVRERRQDAGWSPSRPEIRARDQRLAGARGEHADAAKIPPGGVQGRARGRNPARAAAAAAREQRRPGGDLDQGLASRDRLHHTPAPNPASTASRVACRATHTTATVPASASPTSTAPTSKSLAASGSVA